MVRRGHPQRSGRACPYMPLAETHSSHLERASVGVECTPFPEQPDRARSTLTEMISVALLGPLEVRYDDQQLVVPSGKTTELLMRLALAAGTMVRTERLIDELWADDALGLPRIHCNRRSLSFVVPSATRPLSSAAPGGTRSLSIRSVSTHWR